MNSKTAILVFANSAQEELLHKPTGGQKLFTELTDKTLAIVKSTEIPFFVFTEKNQRGDTFGERFVYAMQSIYDCGFENVIAIGNDTPSLKKQHLLESARQLENNKFVLGPSADGGFYLMGLHSSQFNPATFLKLPWQSRHLAKSISLLINTAKIEVVNLPVLYDIDTVEDLKIVSRFASHLWLTLIKILHSLLQPFAKIWRFVQLGKNNQYSQSFYNKGSPFSLS